VPIAESEAVLSGMPSSTTGGLFMGGAFAFLFNSAGEILLLREQSGGRKYTWDLPGGTLVPDEQPLDGLRREVLEETGLVIEVESPLCHLKWDRHESGRPILVAFYIARTVGDDVRLSSEHVTYRWVDEATLDREELVLPPGREATAAIFALRKHLRT
jgi:8-oxo-dGTP diphosphatase